MIGRTVMDPGREGRSLREMSGVVSKFERHARGAKTVPFTAIPLIDIAPLFGDDRAALLGMAKAIDEACRNAGFFYVKNHGVPAATIERALGEARRFFALPLEEKMRIYYKKARNRVRGFIPLGELKADRTAKGDFQEGFDYALELPADDPDYLAGNRLYGPNQWPEGVPEFREGTYGFFEAAIELGRQLFRAFALALDLPEDYFADKITKPLAQGRVIYYPPQTALDDERTWGIGEHTDYECFTILCQDATGGLQVRNSAGEWVEAAPIPGTFIVNLGDIMKRWTNGIYQSTPHRVLNRTGRERYSLVLFYGANYDTVIECLPTCREAGRPPKFLPVTQGAWTEANLESAYFGN